MPSYCSNCGKVVTERAKKCPKCGAEFERIEVVQTVENVLQAPPVPAAGAEPPSKRSWAIISASLLFITIGAIWSISAIKYLSNPPEPDPNAWLDFTELEIRIYQIILGVSLLEIIIGVLVWKTEVVGTVLGMIFCIGVFVFWMVMVFGAGSNLNAEIWFLPYVSSLLIRPLLIIIGNALEFKGAKSA